MPPKQAPGKATSAQNPGKSPEFRFRFSSGLTRTPLFRKYKTSFEANVAQLVEQFTRNE
jgi:hypothetical protein